MQLKLTGPRDDNRVQLAEYGHAEESPIFSK